MSTHADITVRPLAVGEESQWAALGDDPTDFAREAAAVARRRSGPHAEAAHCALIAVRDEQIVGRLRASEPDRATYVITSAAARDPSIAPLVIAGLLAYVVRTVTDRHIEALSWLRPDQENWHRSLLCAGFEVRMEKAYYRRKLLDYHTPYPDTFEYRSLAEVGEQLFVAALAIACEGSVDRAIHTDDAAGDFASYREFAGPAFDPTQWLIAREAGNVVGIVCPQRFHDVPHDSSIFALAVSPRFRARGFGRVLHARGLEMLSHAGATDYVGSTDLRNEPMRRVFDANGCHSTGVRRYYEMRGRE